METIKFVNDALTFFLEIAMYWALGYFGFHYGDNNTLHYLLGLGLPFVVLIFWTSYMAPKAKKRFKFRWLIFFYFLLFEGSAALLYFSGNTKIAINIAAISLINILLKFFFLDKREP